MWRNFFKTGALTLLISTKLYAVLVLWIFLAVVLFRARRSADCPAREV
ncbi:MAG: hypothetical protein ACE5JR_03910 [Gemmatimonadota bacterium]